MYVRFPRIFSHQNLQVCVQYPQLESVHMGISLKDEENDNDETISRRSVDQHVDVDLVGLQ